MAKFDTNKILELVLSFKNDRDPYSLLGDTLDKMMEITFADAGTVYIVDDNNKLRFRIVRNNTLGMSMGDNDDFILPSILLDENNIKSHCAYSAIHNEVIILDDAYNDDQFDSSVTRFYDEFT